MRTVWPSMETWNLVLPPSRPDARQLGLIRCAIADVDRGAPVGVLGSTPEFRDLLCEEGFSDVRIFDINEGFYVQMTAHRVTQSAETFVHGDWVETLVGQEGDLCVLLSDLTMGNIEYERRSSFYEAIRAALALDGLFIDKVLRHPMPHLPVADLFERYSRLPPNLATVNRFNCEMIFCSELLDAAERVDSSVFYDELERRREMSLNVRAILSRCPLITPRGGIWHYGRPWSVLERDYCRGLRPVTTEDDSFDSPYAGRAQVRVYRRQQ